MFDAVGSWKCKCGKNNTVLLTEQKDVKKGRDYIPREWCICGECKREYELEVTAYQTIWEAGEIISAFITIKVPKTFKNDDYDF